jgi:hypothetical protein
MKSEILNESVKEKDLQETVRDLARVLGWKYYHTHDSRHSPDGFPDCILINPRTGHMMVWELKREKEELKPAQASWLNAFTTIRMITVGVVKPSNLDDSIHLMRIDERIKPLV